MLSDNFWFYFLGFNFKTFFFLFKHLVPFEVKWKICSNERLANKFCGKKKNFVNFGAATIILNLCFTNQPYEELEKVQSA